MKNFLNPTKLIDSEHPAIIKKAGELTVGLDSAVDKARAIFYFIRDEIQYEFRAKFDEKEYFASYILGDEKGFCTQKAILFCALARASAIPAGIYFYDIIDDTLPVSVTNFLQSRTLFYHGIAALHLNGAWHSFDATLDSRLTVKYRMRPVEFAADQDCLMHSQTLDGKPHIEYAREHGLFDDISFMQIVNWLIEGYPHLAPRYSNMMTSALVSTHPKPAID